MEVSQDPSVQEPSLSDDISSIFDEAEGVSEEPIKEAPEGDEAPKESQEETLEETQEEVLEEVIEALDAPNSWKKEFKERFGSIPDREVQEYILQREQDFERGIGEKGQELANFRQRVEQYENALSPLVQNWQMQGMTPEQGVTSLVAWSQALQANPKDTLMELAKQYNVNLEEAFADQPYVDPMMQQYEQKMREMEAQLQQFQQSQQQNVQNAAMTQLDAFEKATDSNGELKHPHFEAVIDDMAYLMQTGRCNDLDTAYETAVRLNPDIQSQLAEEKAKQAAHAKNEQALKAKQVSKQSVSSKETGDITDEDLSLRDAIGKVYDELE